MNIKSIIYVALDWGGTEQILFFNSKKEIGDMWIRIPNELTNEQSSYPIKFNNSDYGNQFNESLAKSAINKIDLNDDKTNLYTKNLFGLKLHKDYLSFIVVKLPQLSNITEIEIKLDNLELNHKQSVDLVNKNLLLYIPLPTNLSQNVDIKLKFNIIKINEIEFKKNVIETNKNRNLENEVYYLNKITENINESNLNIPIHLFANKNKNEIFNFLIKELNKIDIKDEKLKKEALTFLEFEKIKSEEDKEIKVNNEFWDIFINRLIDIGYKTLAEIISKVLINSFTN